MAEDAAQRVDQALAVASGWDVDRPHMVVRLLSGKGYAEFRNLPMTARDRVRDLLSGTLVAIRTAFAGPIMLVPLIGFAEWCLAAEALE